MRSILSTSTLNGTIVAMATFLIGCDSPDARELKTCSVQKDSFVLRFESANKKEWVEWFYTSNDESIGVRTATSKGVIPVKQLALIEIVRSSPDSLDGGILSMRYRIAEGKYTQVYGGKISLSCWEKLINEKGFDKLPWEKQPPAKP